MPKIKDIIPKNELDILNRLYNKDEIISIAQDRYAKQQKLRLKELNNQGSKDVSSSHSIFNDIARGVGEATGKGILFTDWLTNQFDLTKGLISDRFANKVTNQVKNLENIREKKSREGLSKERLAQIKKLQNEYANAKGFWGNLKAGANSLGDTLMHPLEWTTQGVVANVFPTDPANLIAFITGGVGGKVITKLGGGVLSKVLYGVADGVGTNALVEYGVAKGMKKSDEEAKDIAIRSGVMGLLATAPITTASTFMAGKTPTTPKLTEELKESNQKIQHVYEQLKNNEMLKDVVNKDTMDAVATKAVQNEAISDIKVINDAEKIGNIVHENTKKLMQKARDNGATLDEMIAIRDNIKVAKEEIYMSKIINGGQMPSKELSGFKLVNVMEDTIKHSRITPDEVFIKLREKNIKSDLAKVATQSYKEKNTDILVDYMVDKIDKYLEIKYTNTKDYVLKKIDISNKQLIADEKAWSSSLTKKSIDDFIDKHIGTKKVSKEQKDMIYELNKIGLVQDVSLDNTLKKFGLKKSVEGAYDTTKKDITLDNSTSKGHRIQILTHEYIHGATTKLLQNKQFFNDINSLMNSAKKEFLTNKIDIKGVYGFKAVDEFVAEAFSNPTFAKQLNEIKITRDMKKIYKVGGDVKTVWDLIVDKFTKVIYHMTGKRFSINKDSYFQALNSMIGKQIHELEQIKSDRIFTKQSLKKNGDGTKSPSGKSSNHPSIIENKGDGITLDQPPLKDIVTNKNTKSQGKKKDDGVLFMAPSKEQKEKRGIYNVTFNGKNSTQVRKADLNSIVKYEKGFENKKIGKGSGAIHIQKHLKDDSIGAVTKQELLAIGDIIRDGDLSQSYGKNVYTINKYGVNLKVITGSTKNGKEKVITFYSDRNYKEEGVHSTGTITSTSSNKEIIPNKNNKSQGDIKDSRGGIDSSTLLQPAKKSKGEGYATKSGVSSITNNLTSSNKEIIPNKNNKSQGNKKDETILFHEMNKITKENKSIFEKYDNLANKLIDIADKKFHGLDKNGNIDSKTWTIPDMVRSVLVTNVKKPKEFLKLFQANKKEINRLRAYATDIQNNLNKLSKEDSSSLVLALDGDIPKDNIKKTLGKELYVIYEQLRVQIDDNMNKLIEAGLLNKDVAKKDYLKRFYKNHLKDKGLFRGLFKNKYKINEKYFKRKDLTLEQRNSINQIRDSGYVVARTLLEQNRQLKKAQFLSTIADKFSITKEKDGFVQVPKDVKNGVNVYGKLNGRYVSQEILDELEGINKMQMLTDSITQTKVKELTRWIKGTWTAGNPGTQLYNILSNNLNLYLNGLIFTTKNGRTFGGSRGLIGMKKFLSKDTKEAYKKELTDVGLYDDNFFDVLDDVVKDMKESRPDGKWRLKDFYNGIFFKQDSKITQKVKDIYDLGDKVFRVFAYEEHKWDLKVAKYEKEFGKVKRWDKQTKAKIENIELNKEELASAMDEARDMFVDYSKEVPPIVSTLDNYMLAPFLRYTYLATIRQAKVAIKHPIRALIVSLFLEDIIKDIFGIGDNLDSDDILKPAWMKTSFTNFNMYGVNNFIKINDNKDESEWLNLGRAIPGFRMFAITAGLYGDIYKILKENKDKYGREIFDSNDETYTKAVKFISKLSEIMLPPMFPFALSMYHGDKFTEYGNYKKDKNGKVMSENVSFGGRYSQMLLNSAKGSKLDRYGNPVEPIDVIKQMFGLKLQKIDKKDEAIKQANVLSDKYKRKINKANTTKNIKKRRVLEKEYYQKLEDLRKASGKFDLGEEKTKDKFDIRIPKFDF